PCGIGHDQQFHDARVDRKVERLEKEDILAADVLPESGEDVLIAELVHVQLSGCDPEVVADGFEQRGVRASGEDAQVTQSRGRKVMRRPEDAPRHLDITLVTLSIPTATSG